MGVEAQEQLLKDLVGQLFPHLLKDLLVVVVGELIEVADGAGEDVFAPVGKVWLKRPITLFFKLCCRLLYVFYGLLLELIAPKISNHQPLVWQVKLLLILDFIPCLLDKEREAVYRSVFGLRCREQCLFMGRIETLSQFFSLFVELLFFVKLVGHYCVLKVEEVLDLRFLEPFRLVNLLPNFSDVFFQNRDDLFKIMGFFLKVPEYK